MLVIRPAIKADAGLILRFVRELAEYEREAHAVKATVADLERDGFDVEPKFHAVIAEWNSKPAGFALFFYNYSTWEGRPGLYLEDLFVRPEFRQKGIGKSLLVHVARIAIRENCARFQWQVLNWNTPSIQFYESLGARMMKEWLTMRVEGEALKRLAEGSFDQRLHFEPDPVDYTL
jgi:GNAT superfamily N-acetyltransferase